MAGRAGCRRVEVVGSTRHGMLLVVLHCSNYRSHVSDVN